MSPALAPHTSFFLADSSVRVAFLLKRGGLQFLYFYTLFGATPPQTGGGEQNDYGWDEFFLRTLRVDDKEYTRFVGVSDFSRCERRLPYANYLYIYRFCPASNPGRPPLILGISSYLVFRFFAEARAEGAYNFPFVPLFSPSFGKETPGLRWYSFPAQGWVSLAAFEHAVSSKRQLRQFFPLLAKISSVASAFDRAIVEKGENLDPWLFNPSLTIVRQQAVFVGWHQKSLYSHYGFGPFGFSVYLPYYERQPSWFYESLWRERVAAGQACQLSRGQSTSSIVAEKGVFCGEDPTTFWLKTFSKTLWMPRYWVPVFAYGNVPTSPLPAWASSAYSGNAPARYTGRLVPASSAFILHSVQEGWNSALPLALQASAVGLSKLREP